MMNNIEIYSKIRSEDLDEEFYFESLLEEAYHLGELSEHEAESIQLKTFKLLADSIERYNQGKSSSVMIEAAQAILASNLFTISLYLKSLPDTATALEEIKREPLSGLYSKGRKILDIKLKVAKHFYNLACKTMIPNPNLTYNDTIQTGIKTFFVKYNPEFESHETPASIDYQLMNPVVGMAGVEYMIKYLESLYLENLFCSKFDYVTIHEVMRGYREDYRDLLVNIFEQVLLNALGCVLLEKEILSLNIIDPDIPKLGRVLEYSAKENVLDILMQAADKALRALNITHSPMKAYILKGLPEIVSRVLFALNNDTLQTIFVSRNSKRTG